MRLEHLHLLPCDHRASNATDELLALAAEHHARDNLDPPATRAVKHPIVLLGVSSGGSGTFRISTNAPRSAIAPSTRSAIAPITRSAIASARAIAAKAARPPVTAISSISSSLPPFVEARDAPTSPHHRSRERGGDTLGIGARELHHRVTLPQLDLPDALARDAGFARNRTDEVPGPNTIAGACSDEEARPSRRWRRGGRHRG